MNILNNYTPPLFSYVSLHSRDICLSGAGIVIALAQLSLIKMEIAELLKFNKTGSLITTAAKEQSDLKTIIEEINPALDQQSQTIHVLTEQQQQLQNQAIENNLGQTEVIQIGQTVKKLSREFAVERDKSREIAQNVVEVSEGVQLIQDQIQNIELKHLRIYSKLKKILLTRIIVTFIQGVFCLLGSIVLAYKLKHKICAKNINSDPFFYIYCLLVPISILVLWDARTLIKDYKEYKKNYQILKTNLSTSSSL